MPPSSPPKPPAVYTAASGSVINLRDLLHQAENAFLIEPSSSDSDSPSISPPRPVSTDDDQHSVLVSLNHLASYGPIRPYIAHSAGVRIALDELRHHLLSNRRGRYRSSVELRLVRELLDVAIDEIVMIAHHERCERLCAQAIAQARSRVDTVTVTA